MITSNRVELENTATLGHFDRIIQVDTIGDLNELDTEWRASREGTENVAKEGNSLRLIQLGRTDFFVPSADSDRRAAGSAQIAYPVDFAPGCPDPAPVRGLDDRYGRGAWQAAPAATNGDESIGTQRNTGGQ